MCIRDRLKERRPAAEILEEMVEEAAETLDTQLKKRVQVSA